MAVTQMQDASETESARIGSATFARRWRRTDIALAARAAYLAAYEHI